MHVLQKQAEDCAEKNKGPQKVPHSAASASELGDEGDPSSKGLKQTHGEVGEDVEYEGTPETTTSNSGDEDDDSPKKKGEGSGSRPHSMKNLNRDSVDSSQASVSLRPCLLKRDFQASAALVPFCWAEAHLQFCVIFRDSMLSNWINWLRTAQTLAFNKLQTGLQLLLLRQEVALSGSRKFWQCMLQPWEGWIFKRVSNHFKRCAPFLLTLGVLLQGDITVSGNGHYQVNNDAILRLETMTPNEVRVSYQYSCRQKETVKYKRLPRRCPGQSRIFLVTIKAVNTCCVQLQNWHHGRELCCFGAGNQSAI